MHCIEIVCTFIYRLRSIIQHLLSQCGSLSEGSHAWLVFLELILRLYLGVAYITATLAIVVTVSFSYFLPRLTIHCTYPANDLRGLV